MTETKKKDLLFEITFDEDSQTMISFLKRRLTKTPLSLIHKLLRTKKVYLTRERELISQIKSSSILKKGDLIEVKNIINEEKNKETKIVPSSPLSTKIYPIRIVYEDNNIVIICKSYDWTMTKLNDYLCHYFRKNDSFLLSLEKKNFSFLAVHQLDKPVSGLVIFPKNFTSQRIMYQIIKDKKKIIKKYLAICQKLTNYLPFSSKYITGYITKKEEEQKMEFSFHKVNSASKTCSLKIEVKKKEEEKVLLEITLYSGRKHQIRTILSFLKLPILGDVKYGSNFLVKQNKKIDLYAYKLCFIDIPHPLDYLNGKKIVCKHCLDSVTIGGKRNKK